MNVGYNIDYNDEFRKKLKESSGEMFQENFEKLMLKCHYNFKKILPYGNSGDKGNDGYLEGEGIFFQVYGPKTMAALTEKYILKKISTDIKKIIKSSKEGYWENIKEWIFVYNDFSRGITPNISKKLNELFQTTGIKCSSWGIENLVNKFSKLPIDDKRELLNLSRVIPNHRNEYISDEQNWQEFKSVFNYLLYEIDAERIWFGKGFEKKLFFAGNSNILSYKYFKYWNENFIYFFKDSYLNYCYKKFEQEFLEIWDMIYKYYYYDEEYERFYCIRFDENVDYIRSLETETNFIDSHNEYMKKIEEFAIKRDNLFYTFSKMKERIIYLNNHLASGHKKFY